MKEARTDNPHLVDGKYSIKDLINMESLSGILEKFSRSTGFTAGLVSYPEQEVLIGTGWRDICTKFHRKRPESEKFCRQSNVYLTKQLKELKELNVHHCENGLVDGATPIIIEGKHLASLFTGQILFEEPKIQQFRQRALTYGFDVEAYLDALGEVPVVTEEKFESALSFLTEMAVFIAELGLRNYEVIEKAKLLKDEISQRERAYEVLSESEAHMKGILNAAPAGIGLVKNRVFGWVSKRMSDMLGYSADELTGQSARIVYESDAEFERVGRVKYLEIRERGVGSVETRLKRKDGSVLDVLLCSSAVDPGDLSKGAIFTVLDISERKQVEEALQESEEKYRKLVESSIDGITIVQGTEIKFANKAMLDMYGASGAEEIIGQNFTKFVSREHRDLLVQRGLDRERGKDVPNRYEFKALKLDESEFDVEISVNPISYQGKPARQAFLRDISERKRAEDALRESEEKYRLLVGTMPSIVYKGYQDWSVEFLDEKIEVLTGYSMKEFNSGRIKWSDLVVEEDIPGARETFIKALKTDRSYVREYRIKVRSGDILWIQERANIICDDEGDIDYVSGVFFDITERRKAEKALRESEERHRMLLEASPDPIVVYDMEGKTNYVSPAFVETFGWSSQELLGKRIEYVPEENWPETRLAIARMLRGERIQSFETRRSTKDGRILDIQLSSSVFHDRDGDLAGNIVIFRDVTERKKAEEALRKSEAELAAQSRHLEEVNAALKVLLKQREDDKADLEERLLANVKELVLPYVEKLKNSRLHSDQMTLVGILESNMKEIVSPFVTKLSSRFLSLTPTEIQVASLIKDGKTSKEIASLIHASENTVRSHRFHIRSKLGIKNEKVNLRSYLQSLQD
jgi:PAS domain S-box-containing protein